MFVDYWFKRESSDLCVSKSVLVVVDVQSAQQLLCTFPTVHELIVRNGLRVQDAITAQDSERVSLFSGLRIK